MSTVLVVVGGRSLAGRIAPGTLRRIGAVAFALVGTLTLVSAAAS